MSRVLDKPGEAPKSNENESESCQNEYKDVYLALKELGFSKEKAKMAAEGTLEELSKAGQQPRVEEVILDAVRKYA